MTERILTSFPDVYIQSVEGSPQYLTTNQHDELVQTRQLTPGFHLWRLKTGYFATKVKMRLDGTRDGSTLSGGDPQFFRE